MIKINYMFIFVYVLLSGCMQKQQYIPLYQIYKTDNGQYQLYEGYEKPNLCATCDLNNLTKLLRYDERKSIIFLDSITHDQLIDFLPNNSAEQYHFAYINSRENDDENSRNNDFYRIIWVEMYNDSYFINGKLMVTVNSYDDAIDYIAQNYTNSNFDMIIFATGMDLGHDLFLLITPNISLKGLRVLYNYITLNNIECYAQVTFPWSCTIYVGNYIEYYLDSSNSSEE